MNEFSNNVIITQCRTDDLVPCGAIKYSPLAVLKIQAIWVCAKTVDFHCRWTLSLYTSTRSTSVQEDHFHSVYFAAGTASAYDAQDVLVQVLRQDVAHLTCLALAKGMSTLFAKNGFSRPSLELFCGVFRHVLGLRVNAPSKTSVPANVFGGVSIYAQPQSQSQNLRKEPYKKASSLCNRDEAILRVTTLLVEIKTIQPLKKYICKKRMCKSISFLPKFAPTT